MSTNVASRTACDVAVIGAGPAGLSAATLASEVGLDVVLLDEQERPGGQIYRRVEYRTAHVDRVTMLLGDDYRAGIGVVESLNRSNVHYAPNSTVWQALADGTVGVTQNGQASLLRARRIVIATGAMERPVPVPGWNLPGVLSAGAAQTLLKSASVVPSTPTVIAGSGPLALLVAVQLLKAGVPLRALLLTTSRIPSMDALRALLPALASYKELSKGLAWMRALRAAGIAIHHGVRQLAAEGGETLERVVFETSEGRRSIDASVLLLHEGVVPNVALTRAAGCRHKWDEQQLAWIPETDPWGATSLDRVAVAGDGQWIAGAKAAVPGGRLAALDAAYRLGRITQKERDERSRSDVKLLKKLGLIRPFLNLAFPPVLTRDLPRGETIVCRCEEITADELRRSIVKGLRDPNQIKSLTRCGMGQCQGRMCGTTVSRIIADETGKSVLDVGSYRPRIPVRPLPLEALASLQHAASESTVPVNDE